MFLCQQVFDVLFVVVDILVMMVVWRSGWYIGFNQLS